MAAVATPALDPVAVGAGIYERGELPSKAPLRGVYGGGTQVTGAAAACTACHRPSGLGGVEGAVGIPPITGLALFGGGDPVVVRMDRRLAPALSVPHAPFSAEDFARAVREGKGPGGRAMNSLMPRYDLGDAELSALAAYVGTLSAEIAPGVTHDSIRVATVIAPGIAPERRKAFLDTLTTLIGQININVHSGLRQKVPVVERTLGSRRRLVLDTWELTGPASGWSDQLARRQREAPVFALLSGLAGDEWQPVQDFCERAHVGCWFPSVDSLPSDAARGHYSLYFSGGVATEAEVISKRLGGHAGRVLQLVSADHAADAGATALVAAIGRGRTVTRLGVADRAAACGAISGLGAADVLVLWLRPADLAALSSCGSGAAAVFVSATLGGDEQLALPAGLRRDAMLVQPQEAPSLRSANLTRFDAWLAAVKIPAVDRRVQSEAYFATRFFVATTRGMLNNLYTPYLIERGETTLASFEAVQVQEEVESLMMGPMNKRPLGQVTEAAEDPIHATAMKAHLNEMRARGGTTVYPRLSLAAGQRIASKGAYLERLNPDAPGTLGEPEWVVP